VARFYGPPCIVSVAGIHGLSSEVPAPSVPSPFDAAAGLRICISSNAKCTRPRNS